MMIRMNSTNDRNSIIMTEPSDGKDDDNEDDIDDDNVSNHPSP